MVLTICREMGFQLRMSNTWPGFKHTTLQAQAEGRRRTLGRSDPGVGGRVPSLRLPDGYTSDEHQNQLRTMNRTSSMSRTGCCYDNKVMERFFWSPNMSG